ncbi:MAG: hypothetical protein R3E96_00395 [Planctomycetota bacterium]
MVKVIPDDLATEFWGYLKDRGFDKYGREGSAPAAVARSYRPWK